MRSILLSLALVLLAAPLLRSQEKTRRLSLAQCVQEAVEKNINVQTARIDFQKNEYKEGENRSALLPKITVSGNFQDNLKLPVTVLPGEIFGMPGTSIAAKMGSNYSTSAALNFNQVLFNQTALLALKLTKKSTAISILSIEKAREEQAFEVSKLYFLSLATAKQKKLIEENIARTQRMGEIVKLRVENGMSKQVDYERNSVNLENLLTQLNNTEATQAQQMNMIKYTLDLPMEETIVLTDTAEMPLMPVPELTADFTNHVDIQLLESQKEIHLLNQKMVNSGYLPTLSFTGQYSYQGLRQEFKNYFQSNPENQWYASSYIGLSLSIPVFDGLEKRSKSRQAKLDYEKTSMTLDNTKKRFGVNYQNALNNYQNQKNSLQRQKQNVVLAENVYKQTSLKYREGLSTMSDLLQDEMSLDNAQANYLSALYNFKEAELKIMSLNGEIKKIYNK